VDYYQDFAHCVTTGSINNSVTTIPVDETGRIPAGAILTKSEFFMTLIDMTTPTVPVFEIVQVTAKSTSSGAGNLTVVRAQGGSTAASFPSGVEMKSALFKSELLRVRAFLSGSGAAPTYDSDLHVTGDPYARLNTDGSVDLYVLDASNAWRKAQYTRTSTTITTASLAVNATENSTKAFSAAYRLLNITTDRACRVRLYTTSAKRTADASRAIGADPTGDHGLVFEFVATAAVTDYDLTPLVDGYCPTGTDVYYAIENRSSGTSTVVVTFDWIRTE
jgi:hypothetical protein